MLMSQRNKIIHIRCNTCQIMIIEDEIEKHISTQEHQMRKKALECNLADLKGEDGNPSIVLKWSQELSPNAE